MDDVARAGRAGTPGRIGLALGLAGVALLVYLLGGNYVRIGDTVPAELLPVSILREGDLDFNEFRAAARPGARVEDFYAFSRVGDRIVSHYSIVPGLVNLPAHLIAQALGVDTLRASERLARFTATGVVALSVFFMALALFAVCERKTTVILMTGVYAFGTAAWSTGATSLWQHGPSLLFLTAAFAAMLSERRGWLVAAGFLLGMAVWNRPPNVFFALASTAWVYAYRRRDLPWFLAGALPPALGLLAYSQIYWGSVFALGQGHRLSGWHGGQRTDFSGPLLPNLAGLLLSPNRGLFVFTPVFALALPMAWRVFRRPRERPLIFALSLAALAYLLLHAMWSVWWGGGACFGYRLLCETVPVWILLLGLSWERWLSRAGAGRAAFAVLAAMSVYLNFLGAIYFPSDWRWTPESAWSFRDTQVAHLQRRFLAHLRQAEP